jgi:hypothetical protein
MKTKVVCDTNVWYNIGEDLLAAEKLSEYCLVATFYNFEELNTSPKTVSNFHKVRRASKAIIDHSCEQILENAILYLARLTNPYHVDKKFHYNLGIRNWNEIRLMGKLAHDFECTPEVTSLYQQNVARKISESQQVSKIENTLALNVQKEARKAWKQNKQNYFKSSLKGIIGFLNVALRDSDAIELTKEFDISQIELFLSAFLYYYKGLEIGKMVAQPNDMYDLFNLIYVRPGMKYLTMEKRWRSIIAEAGLSHYLLII